MTMTWHIDTVDLEFHKESEIRKDLQNWDRGIWENDLWYITWIRRMKLICIARERNLAIKSSSEMK